MFVKLILSHQKKLMFNRFCLKMMAKWVLHIGRFIFQVEFYFKVTWKIYFCWTLYYEVAVYSEEMQLVLLFPRDVQQRQQRRDFKQGLPNLLSHPLPLSSTDAFPWSLHQFSHLQGWWKVHSMSFKGQGNDGDPFWKVCIYSEMNHCVLLDQHGGACEKGVKHRNSPS